MRPERKANEMFKFITRIRVRSTKRDWLQHELNTPFANSQI